MQARVDYSPPGRRLAITIDSSGSNQETDPSNLRVAAGIAFNDSLISEAEAGPDTRPDRSAVIDFDSSAQVCSPLADPPAANFSCIDSSGGTSIASGIATATGELTRDATDEEVRDRSGIVVLTDGQDSDVGAIISAIQAAAARGIRVSIGFLSPPANPVPPRRIEAAQSSGPPPAYVRAVVDSGGIFAPISSAEDQDEFVELVGTHGATNLDDPNGADDGGGLVEDVGSSGVINPVLDSDEFSFVATAGRLVDFELEPLAGQPLAMSVRDVRTGRTLASSETLASGRVALRVRPRTSTILDVEVALPDGAAPAPGDAGDPYTIVVDQKGVDVRGSSGADSLVCTDEPTFVKAGKGRDVVKCGAGPDLIVGGPAADSLTGGADDDVFVVGSKDLRKGGDTIKGGVGTDVVELPFSKPRGQRCRTARTVVVHKGVRWTLRDVELVTFRGKRC